MTLIPLDAILLPPPVPAGMNLLVLASLAYMYRGTSEHTTPIDVYPEGANYRIHDGRHRYIASLIAGRTHVHATIHEQS